MSERHAWCPGGGYTWGVANEDRAPSRPFHYRRQCQYCRRWLLPVLDQGRTVWRMPAHRPYATGRTPTARHLYGQGSGVWRTGWTQPSEAHRRRPPVRPRR